MFCGKKRHRVCHVLRLACAACRDVLCHFGADSLRQGGGHISFNKAGCNSVYCHIAAGQLPGQAFGQADEPGLAGGVIRLACIAPQGNDAAQIDDPAPALAHHPAGRFLAAKERTLEVCVQHSIKVCLGHAQDQVVPGDACIVHKDIHPAKGVHRLLKELFAALSGGNIGLHGHSLRALGPAERHGLGGGRFAVAVVDHHMAALPGKLYAHCPADSPASAGHNGGTDDGFFVHCSSFHAFRTVSSCAGVSTDTQVTPGRVFFTKPESALPGPTSRM